MDKKEVDLGVGEHFSSFTLSWFAEHQMQTLQGIPLLNEGILLLIIKVKLNRRTPPCDVKAPSSVDKYLSGFRQGRLTLQN